MLNLENLKCINFGVEWLFQDIKCLMIMGNLLENFCGLSSEVLNVGMSGHFKFIIR